MPKTYRAALFGLPGKIDLSKIKPHAHFVGDSGRMPMGVLWHIEEIFIMVGAN